MIALKKWHEVVKNKDYKLLSEILSEDVVFYSPVVFTPQEGKEITQIYLSAAAEVFEGNSFPLFDHVKFGVLCRTGAGKSWENRDFHFTCDNCDHKLIAILQWGA